MNIDVVCADPAFLDITFEGLDALPPPGSEFFARELHESAGGAAITAIGLSRLDLKVATTAPLGHDHAGHALRALLEADGVVCAGRTDMRTPLTVVVPFDGDRALLSYAPQPELDAEAITRMQPRAVIVNAERVAAVPQGPLVYAGIGYPEARRLPERLPELSRARALIVNHSEATVLTGQSEPEAAASTLATIVRTAVVSCGGEGAVAVTGSEVVRVPAPEVAVVDTTGAGDLFTAAYVCSDLAGLPRAEQLQRAVIYASLSVRKATAVAGAASLAELERCLAVSAQAGSLDRWLVAEG